MGWKDSYERAKRQLLADNFICKENRKLFAEFFEFEERKLKRINGLTKLDEGCYKTLKGYIGKFKNVNQWFKNKPWKNLTKEEINKVYDDLEDGNIKNRKGLPFKDKRSYYNKILKGKPFRLAGKEEIVREILEYYADKKDKDVRFLDEEGFKKVVSVLSKPEHLLLFWLSWDIGENVSSILKLTKKDFTRQFNSETKSAEYLVNLPKITLKRSRQTRSEITLYSETVRFLDIIFERGKEIFVSDPSGNQTKKERKPDEKYKKSKGYWKFVPFEPEDKIFNFEKRQATKVFDNAILKTGVKSIPHGDKPTWKDLRSGMACHLFKQGWHSDEINLRLGHKISSRELDVYVSYLAANKKTAKKRIYASNLEDLKNELEESKKREKLHQSRLERQQDEITRLQEDNKSIQAMVKKLGAIMEISAQAGFNDSKLQKKLKTKMKEIFAEDNSSQFV